MESNHPNCNDTSETGGTFGTDDPYDNPGYYDANGYYREYPPEDEGPGVGAMAVAAGALALSGAYVGGTAAGKRGLDITGTRAKFGAVVGVLVAVVWLAFDARLGTLGNSALYLILAGIIYLSWRTRKGHEKSVAEPTAAAGAPPEGG